MSLFFIDNQIKYVNIYSDIYRYDFTMSRFGNFTYCGSILCDSLGTYLDCCGHLKYDAEIKTFDFSSIDEAIQYFVSRLKDIDATIINKDQYNFL